MSFTACDKFEAAIKEFGVVAACEYFGYAADSDFTKKAIAGLTSTPQGGLNDERHRIG